METWGNGVGGLQAAECTHTYHTYSSLYRNHNVTIKIIVGL